MPTRKTTPREERIQWLDREMRAGRYPNAARMQQELGIKRRTAFEDVAHLRDGFKLPIQRDPHRDGWYYAEPCAPLPYLQMPASEATALRHALLLARAYLAPEDADALKHYMERISEHVTAAKPLPHQSAGGGVRLLGGPRPDLLYACEQAIRRRQKLFIRYQSPRQDAPTERTVHPLHLHNENGEWCVITHCESADAIRLFLLARIQRYTLHDEDAAFARPADFDAASLLTRGFALMSGGETVEVVLRFDAFQARWIRERELHSTDTREELPDGGLIVRMNVAWGDEGEAVRRQLLSYGHHVEVLAPASLRDAMRAEVATLAKIYDDG